MRLLAYTLLAMHSTLAVCALAQNADTQVAPAALSAGEWKYTEIRRIPAAEAKQGVVADKHHFYAIDNYTIGKYRKDTGERVGGWKCPKGDPLIHVNAGLMHNDKLYGAHSNFPGVPNLSSVEIWDTETMQHVGTHSFGRADGSLTWIERHKNRWIACFVHYGSEKKSAERGPRPRMDPPCRIR